MKLILFVCLISVTLRFAQGTIDIIATSTKLSFGGNVQLTCEVSILTNTVTWRNTAGSLTDCLSNTDLCVPDSIGRYNFSSDVSNRKYYLDITGVTTADETDFICRQALTPVETTTKTFTVEKLSSGVNPVITETGTSTLLTATSECIYPSAGYVLTWYTVTQSGGKETKYEGSIFNLTTTNCPSDGGVEVVSSFTHTNVGSLSVFFIAKLTYNGVIQATSEKTTNTYLIKGNETTTVDPSTTETTTNKTTTETTTNKTTAETTTNKTTPEITTNKTTTNTVINNPTTTTPPQNTTTETGDKSSTTLIIVLSVVGGVFIVGILGTLLVLYLRKHSSNAPVKGSSAGNKKHEKSSKQLRRTPTDYDTLEVLQTHNQYKAYDQFKKSTHNLVPDQNRIHGRQPLNHYSMYGGQRPMYGRQSGTQYQVYGRHPETQNGLYYDNRQQRVAHVINPVFGETNYGYVPNMKKERYGRDSRGTYRHDNRNYRNTEYSNNWG